MNINSNLLKNVFSYLKPKDLAKVEQVSHNYNQQAQNFNSYWREECNNYFSSDYEHYRYEYLFNSNSSLINSKGLEKQLKDYFYLQGNSKDSIDWKKLFAQGIKNRKLIKNYKSGEGLAYLNIKEDLINTENLIYSTLKDFLALPKLRRENFYLENELNSTHQSHNYEFLYDQQDLYDYYNNIFQEKEESTIEKNPFSISPQHNSAIRREDLPFAGLLQNFMDLLLIFNKSDGLENKLNLGKLRWYSCEDKFIFREESENSVNPIIFILKTIIGKIIIFCRITLNYIKKYEFNEKFYENFGLNFLVSSGSSGDKGLNGHMTGSLPNQNTSDQLFLSEYLKRYKSFFDAAIHINEEMENLNVLVNYLYENSFQHYPSTPKFSIYRLMVVIWNREVLHPLLKSENQNSNLYAKLEKLYRQYLNNVIHRGVEREVSSMSPQRAKNSQNAFSSFKNPFSSSLVNSFSSFSNSFMELNSKSDTSRLSNSSDSYDNSYEFSQNDDFLPSDFNTKHFIEQISASILDSDCNEFSTFYVNYTQMKTSKYYSTLEEIFYNTLEDVVRTYYKEKPENKYKVFKLLGNLDSHIRFINKTKIDIMKTLCRVSVESSVEDLVYIFQEFLSENAFTLKEADNFFKINQKIISLGNCNYPEIQAIHNQLLQIAFQFLQNEKLAEYATVLFVKEIQKNSELSLHNHQMLKIIEEGVQSYYEEFHRLEELNNKILKENRRRNISFNMKESEELLFAYDTIAFECVEQMYLKEMNIETAIFEKQLFFREKRKKSSSLIDNLNPGEKIDNQIQDDDLSLRSTLGSIYDLESNMDMDVIMSDSDNFIN